MGALGTIRVWARMVKFSHSIFALPFALSGAVLAAADRGIGADKIFWIVVAMLGARNAAMGFNRLADQEYDARNPRTAGRALPMGLLSRQAVWVFTVVLSGLFVLASFQLNRLCGLLSPLALFIILGYSYTKRFTWANHLWLGLSLSMAPVGGWVAVQGSFAPAPWILGAAVLMWVTGFDVIYACQDVDFDRKTGLYSVPARFGAGPALFVARLLHASALIALIAVGVLADLHPVYWLGLLVVGTILIREHRLVKPDDLSDLGTAFFNMNAWISVIYLATVLLAVIMPGLAG